MAFLDDDDLWHPEKLERQLSVFRSTGVDAVTTALLMFHEGNPPAWEAIEGSLETCGLSLGTVLTLRAPFPSTPTNLILRERLLRVRGFSEHTAYRAVEDYDLWCRLQAEKGFRWVAIKGPPLAAARQAGVDSISSWRRVPAPDLVRQRWAMLEILTRIFAAHRHDLDASKREILAKIVELADECAHRSRLIGWRRSSIGAYRIAARAELALGNPWGAAKRLTRAVRFGMLGAVTERVPAPETVSILRARIERYVRAIARGDTLIEPPLSVGPNGSWSSIVSQSAEIEAA